MATRGRHVDEEVVPILRVADTSAAIAWYARLGFLKESEHRFAPGRPAFVTVARGSMRLFLSEHTGDARPDTLIYLRVRDIEIAVPPSDVILVFDQSALLKAWPR